MRAAKCLGGVVGLLIAGSVLAADLSPDDFAYGMPVLTPGSAAAYRLALPAEVYQRTVHDNLSDLRVFNAQGEEVPLVLALPAATPPTAASARPLPLFPLRGESVATLDTLRLTIGEQGSTINLQTQGAHAATPGATRYVLDGRGLDAAVTAISVQWPDDAADFAGKLKIEASDSLGAWHTVIDGAPIANLHANGQQLIERRVELPAMRANFWQLSWVGTSPPFELTGAAAEPAVAAGQPARSNLVVSGTPVAGNGGEIDFDLGIRAPVERINLELPSLNTVVSAELLSRARAADPWHVVLRSGFYRLQGTSGELHNGPIDVPSSTDRYWRVRPAQAASAIGSGMVRLEVQWRAHELTFLARGGGPYQLAFGSSAVASAGAVFGALPAGVAIVDTTAGAVQSLGGEERLKPAAAPFPWKVTALWAILGIAALLLAAMAYRLSRNVGSGS